MTMRLSVRGVNEYVVYESDTERKFAERLNERKDRRLFLKLPGGFEIDTPVAKYIPDWAIGKHEDETLYLVRETKSTKDFLKLRTTEADKVRLKRTRYAVGSNTSRRWMFRSPWSLTQRAYSPSRKSAQFSTARTASERWSKLLVLSVDCWVQNGLIPVPQWTARGSHFRAFLLLV